MDFHHRTGMSALAILIADLPNNQRPRFVQSMLEAAPHRSTDGVHLASTTCCSLGYAQRGCTGREQQTAWPARDGNLWVLADLRLDNREELCTNLFGTATDDVSDDRLLLAGYRRWETDLANRLVGDFALLIWDETVGSVYAARDPFGVRPLFCRQADGWLAFASEAEQLLVLEPVDAPMDEQTVADYLTDEVRSLRRTFFRGIERVEPGHWWLARPDGITRQRYWLPPRTSSRHLSATEGRDEFRRRFFRSVGQRLEAQQPALLHLSGGIDSSAIAGVAGQLAKHGRLRAEACRLVSAVYPGLDCDESAYIDAVRQRTGLPHENWDGTESVCAAGVAGPSSHPWGAGKFGSVAGDWRIAQRLGARVIVSGFGGDELLFERGIFADLARAGRWLELLRQGRLAPRYSTRSARYFVLDGLRALLPGRIRACYRRWRPATRPAAPSWWGAKLRELAAQGSDDGLAEPAVAFGSRTQEATWHWLTRPGFLLALEWQVLEAGRAGIEMRYPYLDRRLVECVLELPYEQRLPDGRMKRLAREALRDCLPACVADRRAVTTFDANIELQFRRSVPAVAAVLERSPWHSTAFVNQTEAVQLLRNLAAAPPGTLDWTEIATVWNIALLELWLHRWQPRLCRAS
ncbi:MAG: hypothetical protein JNM56_24360 [Planctomycetia bacterium]|nr:hypothetical protein [Planctomycetia bacterium]